MRLDKEEANGLQKDSDKGLQTVTVNLHSYNHIAHGYAATIHKSQGVTVDRAYLLASRYLDRHATYVGMSRHRESADLFYSKEEFPNERDLYQTLGRDRVKDISLDYAKEDDINKERYARYHGIEISESLQKPLKHSRAMSDSLDSFKKKYEARQNLSLSSKDALSAFKARYESQKPEMARLHQEMIIPSEEKAFALQVDHFAQLQQKLYRGEATQKELNAYANALQKQPRMMEYLQYNQRRIYEEVREIIRIQEKQQQRVKELSRGRGLSQ